MLMSVLDLPLLHVLQELKCYHVLTWRDNQKCLAPVTVASVLVKMNNSYNSHIKFSIFSHLEITYTSKFNC